MLTITAIIAESSNSDKSIVAQDLSVLRTGLGKKLVLVDCDPDRASFLWTRRRQAGHVRPKIHTSPIVGQTLQPELDRVRWQFSDIIIDTEARDCPSSRTAMIAAHCAVVCVRLSSMTAIEQEKLVQRVASARTFNPRLRVIIAAHHDVAGDPQLEAAAVREFTSKAPLAGSKLVVIHDRGATDAACEPGISVVEQYPRVEPAVTDMQNLYDEVFIPKQTSRVFRIGSAWLHGRSI